MATIGRRAYAEMFGPTVGDRLRLADTELLLEVEADHTLRAGGYGEEVKFGGGKTIRDGMAQSQRTRTEGAVDTVLTNALVIDHTGIFKADIGLRSGRIASIGKAGNPDTQPGVDIVIGPGTEVISCEGHIVTAGGIDSHIHFICPQQIEEALASGITTMLGGGTGPATGTLATTCTPGAFHMERMLQAADAFPMRCTSRSTQAPLASSCTKTGAPRPPPSATAWMWPKPPTRRWPSIATHSTNRGLWRTLLAPWAGAASAPFIPKARAAATRPTSCAWWVKTTFCPAPPTPPCPTRATRWTSMWTCSWCATTSMHR